MKQGFILLLVGVLILSVFYYVTRPKILSKSFKTTYYGHIRNEVKTIPTEYQALYQFEDVPFIKKEPKHFKIDVHDSSIQKGHSYNYGNSCGSGNTTFKTISDYSNNDAQIKEILSKIENRNSPMVLYNMETESNIIANTFEKGDDNVKHQVLTVLKEIDAEGLMCPTGVVTRIREAAFINEPEKLPVTEETLQQQMLNKAALLNEQFQDYFKTKQQLLAEYSKMYPTEKIEKIINEWQLE